LRLETELELASPGTGCQTGAKGLLAALRTGKRPQLHAPAVLAALAATQRNTSSTARLNSEAQHPPELPFTLPPAAHLSRRAMT
jgi:hypothetical protein